MKRIGMGRRRAYFLQDLAEGEIYDILFVLT